jgi:hypothetical protein
MTYVSDLVSLSPCPDESGLRLPILPTARRVKTPHTRKRTRWLKLLYACRRMSAMIYALPNMVGAGRAACCRHGLQNLDL